MTVRNVSPVLSALVIALVAGAASSVLAQNSNGTSPDAARNRGPDREPYTESGRSRDASTDADPAQGRRTSSEAASMDFRSSDWLTKRTVVNSKGSQIAVISDFILDRGSGLIEHAIIKTGTGTSMAGFERAGRSIAVPYSSLRWETGDKDRFLMTSTAEELNSFPEYTPESWRAMENSTGDDESQLRRWLSSDSDSMSDPYVGQLGNASRTRVEGEVTAVERNRSGGSQEEVVVTLRTADGSSRKVALGPSWWINGIAAAPMRGETISVDTVTLPTDPDRRMAGTDIRWGDRKLNLRGNDGSPAWRGQAVEANGHSYSMPYSRYMLLSELKGMKIECRSVACGTVNEAVLDRHSGQVAFLSIDPDENFLGIGDTKRLVPWTIATVALDRTMRIDASREMLLSSPETPSDFTTLDSRDRRDGVYNAYNVHEPPFQSREGGASPTSEGQNAWSARGPILSSIDGGSQMTIHGRVVDVADVKCEGGARSARAIRIQKGDGNDGEELVLLGPAWYMDNQQPMCMSGDVVTVDARRTTIDGRQYWIAKSIDCKNKRVVLLDANNSPAWDQP